MLVRMLHCMVQLTIRFIVTGGDLVKPWSWLNPAGDRMVIWLRGFSFDYIVLRLFCIDQCNPFNSCLCLV